MITIDGKQIKLQIWDTVKTKKQAKSLCSYKYYFNRLVKKLSAQSLDRITEELPVLC